MIIDELFEAPQQCPECGGISFSDLILAEKKDACYHKVKASAKVWPSAYASGRLVQCRKKGAANYGNKSEGMAEGKADPTGSWVVYDGSKVKRFKSREGAKAYAAKNGGKVASNEFYADKIQKQGVAEGVMYGAENLNVGDDVIISGDVELNGATGVIDSFGQDKRFVVVDLYNHGRHSFHSSDVSANDYDSDEHDDDVLDEKSVSQAQFRTMAGAAHNPEFARKVGISQDVAKEFNQADKKSNYKKLPARATEGEQQKGADYRDPKEVDYDDEYDAMVARVKKLAGLGPMKTVYDPTKRQYRNMPTAVQPKK